MGATPYDLPNLDTEADRIRALGVKNSGVKEFRQDRVFPVNRLDSDNGSLSDGKLLEFRLRSDSNQWINWRETKIKAEFEIAFTGSTESTATTTAPTYQAPPLSVRMTALPIHALFDGGMQYTLNSQLIDNQTHPYQSAMIALHSRTDAFDLATTGSGALMSLAKDTGENFRPADPGAGKEAKGDEAKLLNPKCAILQEFYQPGTKVCRFEVSEPLIGLQSLQHGYFAPPGDHKLEFQVANSFEQNLAFDSLAQSATGAVDSNANVAVISSKKIPLESALLPDPTKVNGTEKGEFRTMFINIRNIELSVCYVSPAGPSYIPRGVALKFSPYQISTLAVRQKSVLATTVVPPATRAVYLWLRQGGQKGPQHDFEELGLATMGINILKGDNTEDATKIGYFQNLEIQLGGSIAGRYTAMNPIQGKMQAPWNDYLSSIGRPTGMRGSQLTYTEYCGVHNTDVTHTRPGGTSAIANVGKTCGGFWMRIINPSGNLSNMLQIRGELSDTPGQSSQLELVICAVSDRLLQCSYVEGQEIPVSTSVTDIL